MPADPIAMDRKFVKDVAESSAVQMDLGKLAQEKGSSLSVKESASVWWRTTPRLAKNYDGPQRRRGLKYRRESPEHQKKSR